MCKKCDHIIGLEKDKLISISDKLNPHIKFTYCPKCAAELAWEYLLRGIMFP